jgi:hypothetical protein
MKKVIRLTESDLNRIVKRIINEEEKNKKVSPMEYFDNIGGDIQDDIDMIVKWNVDPYRHSTVDGYFKSVCKHVWDNLEGNKDVPSKRDFMKFMRKEFYDYISNHMYGLRR